MAGAGFVVAVNGIEGVAWLEKNGMSAKSVENPILVAGYDLVFGFKDGDTTRPDIAAGTAAFGILQMMLGFRGSFFYKFRYGTGDVLFAPLYATLKRDYGVKFKFFRKVTALTPPADRSHPRWATRKAGSQVHRA